MTSSAPRDPGSATRAAIGRFGRYTMIRKIAHGGMATLFLARLDGPVGFEKFFAIKKIHPHLAEEQEFVAMFLDEARFAAQIQHPNVVQIFELGEEDGDFFFAMEYLSGESLAEVMKEMALRSIRPPIPLLAHVIARTATGLHAAHELRGPDGLPLELVHRDISPHNILVTYDGEVKLVDFGIAKAAGRLSQTATGELKGKYAYMSPEQVLGSRALDRRSDLFSLGVVLYEATTLRRLFKAENELLTLDKLSRCEIPAPSSILPGYPAQLEAILLRCLRRDPEARYRTAAELAEDLDAFVASTTEHTSSAAVARWMSEHFGAHRDEKQRMLEEARTAPTPGATVALPVGAGSGLPWFMWGALAAVLAFGLTLAGLYVSHAPGPPPTGILHVQSSPAQGVVAIDDGPALGRTPLEVDGLALGDHAVEVRAPGFEPRSTSFEIRQVGQLVTVLVPLERLVEATPTPPPTTPAGPTAPDAGHEPAATTAAGSSGPHRPPRQPGAGYLNLATRPWASVYLGGRKLGTTPLVKARLPAGRQRLKLLPRGEPPPRYISVRVTPGQTVRKTVSF